MSYVIIGNSAAGLSAIETIRKFDTSSTLTLICDETGPAYSRVLTPYFIAGDISEEGLYLNDKRYYKNYNIKTILGNKAVSINVEKKKVILEDGKSVRFNRLLIATGASPLLPGFKGSNDKKVSGLRTIEDARRISYFCDYSSKAIVSGAGLVGLQVAQALCKRGISVDLVVSSQQVLSQMLDTDAAGLVQKRVEESGARIFFGRNIIEITSIPRKRKESRIVKLDGGEELKADFVIVGKGVSPNLDLIKESPISINRGIIVDEYMRTNIDDIYAAGDVAESSDYITGRKTIHAIWPCAVDQGRIAAMNMMNIPCNYDGALRMNVTHLFGVTLVSIGVISSKDPSDEIITFLDIEKSIYRKLTLRNNVIIGAVLAGKIDDSGVLHGLIRQKMDISPWKDIIIRNPMNMGKVYVYITKGVK